MATPFLFVLRKTFGDAFISVVCRTYVSGVLRRCSAVDRLYEYERHGGLRSEVALIGGARPVSGWDTCYVLPPSFSSALAGLLSRARRRIGYGGEWRSLLLTDALPRTDYRSRHLSSAYAGLIEYETGSPVGEPPHPVVVPPYEWRAILEREDLHGDYAVIAAGAVYGRAKMWPLDRFAALAGGIAQRTGWRVVAVGTGKQREEAAAILQSVRGPARNLAGEYTVDELLSVLRGARLVVGNDSGPVHISAAMGVPTVAIFGSTSPAWTAPRGRAVRVVSAGLDCAPCFRRECPQGDPRCMTGITVDDVLTAAFETIGERVS